MSSASANQRLAQRVAYYSNPAASSSVSSSLRTTRISPSAALNLISETAPARLDRKGYLPTSSPVVRSDAERIHLYY